MSGLAMEHGKCVVKARVTQEYYRNSKPRPSFTCYAKSTHHGMLGGQPPFPEHPHPFQSIRRSVSSSTQDGAA